jgi:hypothetical protein
MNMQKKKQDDGQPMPHMSVKAFVVILILSIALGAAAYMGFDPFRNVDFSK